jgi:mannose-6-phosphate isomerase-like protein (cupin superfamily)
MVYKTVKGMNKMYYVSYNSPYSYYVNRSMYNDGRHPVYWSVPQVPIPQLDYRQSSNMKESMKLQDYGTKPFVLNIEEATKRNKTFRTALWTGNNLQVSLMSIPVGEDIGLEIHPTVDQFLRIEEGQGVVQMGDTKDHLDYEARVYDDYAIMVPAGKWHNLTNTGNQPLKLYTIYAPPEHPFGTVHRTKAEAMAAEENH